MKIFKLYQNENNGWDTFDSIVVAAETKEEAIRISPHSSYEWSDIHNSWMYLHGNNYRTKEKQRAWANDLDQIEVEEIGITNKGVPKGVIVASFNAG